MIKPLAPSANFGAWRDQIAHTNGNEGWFTRTTSQYPYHHFCKRYGRSFLNLRKSGHTAVEFVDLISQNHWRLFCSLIH